MSKCVGIKEKVSCILRDKKREKKKRCIIAVRNMLKVHKKSVLVLILSVFLSFGVWMRDQADAENMVGVVERGAEGGSAESRTFGFWLEESEETEQGDSANGDLTDSEKQELELEVSAIQRDREESLKLLESAVIEWETAYLGGNDSANEVRQDLNLPDEACDGAVQISCESSDYEVLQTDGTVITEDLAEEGELVELTVSFVCGEYTRLEIYTLHILPPEEGSTEWILSELQKAAENAEEESREEEQFSLPDSIAGYRVLWSQETDYEWAVFLLIGVAAVFYLEQKEKQDEKARLKKRREQLVFEYPQMVDQFAILLDSGMTIRKAWERILIRNQQLMQKQGKNHGNTGVYLEEMWITYREIREGWGEREAYERFGRRIELPCYKRFSSILTQNLSKGTKGIREVLQRESEEALEMRRNRAKKMGEEASTRLLFPMLIMLVLILMVLLVPALVSF